MKSAIQLMREELDTPERRTKFMRGWMESQPESIIVIFDVTHYGYDNRQHCEEELFKHDKEVCFFFFPHLKGQDEEDDYQETGISTDYNVTVSGGSSAC